LEVSTFTMIQTPIRTLSRTRAAAVAVLATLGALSFSACSSSTPAAETTAISGSDYTIVSDAEVLDGLTKVSTIMATLEGRLKVNEADARAGLEEMYNTWFTVEGTIRKNIKDVYLDMEDGLVSTKIGVEENRPKKIIEGISQFESARTAYIAKRP
jgi:hypothetical protein